MNLVKKRRKWVIEGEGEGWIFKWVFPAKWKALIGIEVFQKGGRVSDYWIAARKHPKRVMHAGRVRQELESALEEMQKLEPTTEEIEEYGKAAGYGVVTYTRSTQYFPPTLHDTWGSKKGGRVHIDIGSNGTHLMLDKFSAWAFIGFIEEKRKVASSNSASKHL